MKDDLLMLKIVSNARTFLDKTMQNQEIAQIISAKAKQCADSFDDEMLRSASSALLLLDEVVNKAQLS